MEKELEELSAFFENMKNVITLVDVIQEKYMINSDVLNIIYNILLRWSEVANIEAKNRIGTRFTNPCYLNECVYIFYFN